MSPSGRGKVTRVSRLSSPLAAAAATLAIEGGVIQDARVVLGQVAPMPWESREAAALVDAGRPFEAADRLRPVRGPVGELMAGWIADVDARLVADALLQRVDALIVNGRR